MRLQLIAAVAGALVLCARVRSARADDPVTVSVDTFVYTDTDNVVVVSPQVAAHAPLDDRGSEVAVRATVDVVTAASVDVITEATPRFTEVREEADVSGAYALGRWLPSLHYRLSSEPDYLSNGGGVAVERRLGPDTTLSFGYDLTIDRVGRSGTPATVFSAPLTTHTGELSVTQVLGPRLVLRVAYSLVGQSGYMEKPYRYVPLFNQAGLDRARADGVSIDAQNFGDYRLPERPAEEVPDLRLRQAIALRVLRYLPSLDASLRADYRLYLDDWGVTAHTGELALRIGSGGYEFDLSNRAYYQSAADFWQRAYVVTPGSVPRYRSVDRDLGNYLSDTVELGLVARHGDFSWYVTGAVMYTRFYDFMFLDSRTALTTQLGLRWDL